MLYVSEIFWVFDCVFEFVIEIIVSLPISVLVLCKSSNMQVNVLEECVSVI